MLSPTLLHNYQHRAIEHITTLDSCALFIECGLGKTIITLTALAEMFQDHKLNKVLIVAPKRVTLTVWKQEAAKWNHTKDLKFSIVVGNAKHRVAALNEKADIFVINYESLTWLVENYQMEFDRVVFDEFSLMKSHSTKRFKALKSVRHKIKGVIGLTGTPASNGLLNLWSQLWLLDKGKRLGKTYTSYRDRYFVGDYMGYNWDLRRGADEEIHKKISDICLSMSAKDYLDMPKTIKNVIKLPLSKTNRKQYERLEKDFILKLDDETIVADNAAALTNSLLQYCNGFLYSDLGFKDCHDVKLNALQDIVEESQADPILVVYNFKVDLLKLKAKFPQAVQMDDNPRTVKRWNRGEIPMLLIQPKSAGHGLNLQYGGNIIVWYGLNWSLEANIQTNARLARQGQEKPVIIHYLAVENSVDEIVLEALERKDVCQKALLSALKVSIESKKV